jgi:aspartyl/glutamyl-tRNA(Asn/Gln) amidotransferase C subunit
MSLFLLSRRSFSVVKQIKEKILPNPIKFDIDIQKKLERISLVSFQNEQTIKKVEQTIHSSDIIHQANVDHLQPLYTLVETELCPLRQTDTISNEKTLQTKQVLQNASETYEDYLVAPMIGKRDSQTVEKVDKSEL